MFKARRPARTQPCACGCGERAAHWHHWLEQEHIRVYARGLRLPDQAHDKLLRALLRDERNLSAYAAGCHLDTREGQTGFTAEDVPASAHQFAAELGPEWAERLRREYRSTNDRGGHP